MPFEHEHKFILTDFRTLFDRLNAKHKQHLIDQFYISDNARFRRVETEGDPRITHCFTYKQRIAGRVMEFEQPVSSGDFHHAFKEHVGALYKIRFKIPSDDPEVTWDIDFFLTDRICGGGSFYLAMAEVEHPPGREYTIPEYLEGHILTKIPEQDAHLFSNRQIQDQEYTREILVRYRPKPD